MPTQTDLWVPEVPTVYVGPSAASRAYVAAGWTDRQVVVADEIPPAAIEALAESTVPLVLLIDDDAVGGEGIRVLQNVDPDRLLVLATAESRGLPIMSLLANHWDTVEVTSDNDWGVWLSADGSQQRRVRVG
ncbi:hypothetical protein [Tsukamurella paurometabola]|uniref:Uncharacterized protein n=1 Tax=Tsukamurella paurometabola TaxID=2061 RepID=A0A3P8K4X1_TSUPA|nr:hypothetical protein [Tsukamurella paurometabola]UEA83286.1 hypothetical protein LK411_00030 [Tsukamurella paurometabola]VDR40389.1 Uncharacterised protein [Tsukamurella paurometabola]